LLGIVDGWAIVDFRADGITVFVFTAGKPVPFVSVVTHAFIASKRVFTGGIVIAFIDAQFAFIDVLAGEAIPIKSGITHTVEASGGIRTHGIGITRCNGWSEHFACISHAGAI